MEKTRPDKRVIKNKKTKTLERVNHIYKTKVNKRVMV